MENEMKRNKQLHETIKFFMDKDQAVHITLNSGRWINGKIVSVEGDRLILVEEKFGEILVLFERIIDDGIVPREEKV